MPEPIRIEINYPESEMEKNRRRWQAAMRFEWYDRVPVLLGLEARYALAERGVGWLEYFSDPKTQMYHQLLNQKFFIENAPDDRCQAPSVTVSPDFQNITNASGCGCEIIWSDKETPRARPFLDSPEEALAWKPRDHTSGLWGKRLRWYDEMLALRDEFRVFFNGEEIPIRVGLCINGDSPFMTALEMAQHKFLLWMKECP